MGPSKILIGFCHKSVDHPSVLFKWVFSRFLACCLPLRRWRGAKLKYYSHFPNADSAWGKKKSMRMQEIPPSSFSSSSDNWVIKRNLRPERVPIFGRLPSFLAFFWPACLFIVCQKCVDPFCHGVSVGRSVQELDEHRGCAIKLALSVFITIPIRCRRGRAGQAGTK